MDRNEWLSKELGIEVDLALADYREAAVIWLGEKHNLSIMPDTEGDSKGWTVFSTDRWSVIISAVMLASYELAMFAAIDYVRKSEILSKEDKAKGYFLSDDCEKDVRKEEG